MVSFKYDKISSDGTISNSVISLPSNLYLQLIHTKLTELYGCEYCNSHPDFSNELKINLVNENQFTTDCENICCNDFYDILRTKIKSLT